MREAHAAHVIPPIASSTVRSGDVESSFINCRYYRFAVEP